MHTLHIAAAIVFSLSITATPGDELLNGPQVGQTTPDDLIGMFPHDKLFRDKNGHVRTVVGAVGHVRYGAHFRANKLAKYDLIYPKESPELAAVGGWDGFTRATRDSLGDPTHETDDGQVLVWDQGPLTLTISNPGPTINLTVEDKRTKSRPKGAPQYVQRIDLGGPYHFSGFKPEWTKTIKLNPGRHLYDTSFQGRGHIAIWLYVNGRREELILNDVGSCFDGGTFDIDEKMSEVYLQVNHEYEGMWKVTIRRLDGKRYEKQISPVRP